MEARKLVDFPGGLELHIGVNSTLHHLKSSVSRLSTQQLTDSPKVLQSPFLSTSGVAICLIVDRSLEPSSRPALSCLAWHLHPWPGFS